jgi:hypothetical protein
LLFLAGVCANLVLALLPLADLLQTLGSGRNPVEPCPR